MTGYEMVRNVSLDGMCAKHVRLLTNFEVCRCSYFPGDSQRIISMCILNMNRVAL